MSQKLLDIYTSILRFSGMETDDEGYVFNVLGQNREPTFIDKRRLVLPTEQHLKHPSPSEKIIFHPLTEDVFKGESAIIEKLKRSINIKLNYTFAILVKSLMKLAASPELHQQLDPDQAELLIALKEADDAAVTHFVSLMLAAFKQKPEASFINIYLSRGGKIKGKKYSRAGIVSWPIYRAVNEDEKSLYGVKLRIKDRKLISDIYQFIFSSIGDKEAYNYGSDSLVAPYLDALLHTAMIIARQLSDILDQYRNWIDEPEALEFDGDWVEPFANLPDLLHEIRSIPHQELPVTTAPVAPAVGMTDAPSLPVPQPAPMAPSWGMGPSLAPTQAPVPGVRVTKNGIDFQSLKQLDPSLAGAPMGFGQPPGYPGYGGYGYSAQPPNAGWYQQPPMNPWGTSWR